MTMARRDIVGIEGSRGIYHCVVRCVRRAFLCGDDAYSGRNYDHRKEWIRGRLGLLTQSFGVELLTYAVMSNHLHTVLRTRPDLVASWSDVEVAERWLSVYTPRHFGEDGEPVYEVRERDILCLLEEEERVKVLRKRLSSLSWFMKALNEHISRRANREDDCKGRFWESRFKSQRLENEAAVLACMCYVDLNPVRASLANGLEDSVFTGAYDRIMAKKAPSRLESLESASLSKKERERSVAEMQKVMVRRKELVDLSGEQRPFSYLDEESYLHLLDWTGRQIRSDKPGHIKPEMRALLEGVELDADEWVKTVKRYNTLFGSIAGTVDQLRKIAAETGRSWLKGCKRAETIFRPSDRVAQPG
jgi:REP element-mobilizing transposase RayT